MSSEHEQQSKDWICKTKLFHKADELRNELDRKKWIESEKAGHDIGMDRARIRWLFEEPQND